MEEKNKNKIRLLSEQAINQIAAGEVIENAASVVKELIENAVDAGATHICVETTGGGRGSISIKDDGCGMNREDLLLSIERHTTSKIVESADLYRLSTLGFRGEALASIASVSHLTIHSATEIDEGLSLRVEGGKVHSCVELPRRRGTTVEVSSLFFNVPARKKFQKSAVSEILEIHKVLTHAALCYPEISFEWISEGKKEFSLFEADRLSLLGAEFEKHALSLSITSGRITLTGNVVASSLHRPNRVGQYLFVNRRPVLSSFVSSIVEEGYGTRLPTHRFPLYLLYLQVPPDEIDVNIHPRKKEIRFLDEKKIREVILQGVSCALEEKLERPVSPKITWPAAQVFSLSETPLEIRSEVTLPPPELKKFHLLMMMGEYLLFKESEEEILLVDSRRARARVFYEKMDKKQETISVQHLLFPLQVEKSQSESRKMTTYLPLLNELGILIRSFGTNAFVIEAFPDIFQESEVLTMIDSLLDEFSSSPLQENRKKAALLFCRALGKKTLTSQEAVKLVEELFASSESTLCPEGKVIWKRITPKEMSKWL